MSTLNELLAERAEIERKIAQLQSEERSGAIAKVRALMADFGLSMVDLGTRAAAAPRSSSSSSSTKKVAAKYRNTATGESWSGRGLQPKWLKAALGGGRSIEEFKL